jgi:transposase
MLLTADVQAEILTLHFNEKRSVRSIARQMGVDRKTVRRLIERRKIETTIKMPTRRSILDPYVEQIRDLMRKDPKITSTAILNQLRVSGYTGGISVLKSLVQYERGRFLRPREAFLRLEFAAGEVAQVDWGEFGDVFGNGVKTHCFAMVLAYSRYMYIEFTRSEKFEEFIRCHENAFKFFGGVPKECWYDNLTSAVSDRIGQLIRFNSRFMTYIGHHSIRPHACNVASGNEKGRVEDLIKYIRMNFWPGRTFKDFDDLMMQAIIWRNQVANLREHRSTRRVVKLLFESEEKPKLMALNPTPYDTDEVFSRNVSPDFLIQYETNRYSVPWTLVGMVVTVRVNNQTIKVYYNEKFITSHPRSYIKNRVFTNESHRAGLLERKPGATRETWQISYVKELGPEMANYVELIRQGPRSLKHELKRLVALVTVYGKDVVLDACRACMSSGVVGVDSIELYIKRRSQRAAEKPEPIQFTNERLNRVVPAVDLRKYNALYFEGFEQPTRASEDKNEPNEQPPNRGPNESQTQVLEPGDRRRSGSDERDGARIDDQIPFEMDREGEIGAPNADDTKQSEIGEVPPSSDGRNV